MKTNEMLKLNEDQYPRNLQILRDYTGIPFEGFQDNEYKVHAVFKYDSQPKIMDPDYSLYIGLRFCEAYKEFIDKHLPNKAIHILYENAIATMNSGVDEFIIPNINVSESKNLFDKDDIICEEEKAAQMNTVEEKSLTQFSSGKYIQKLSNQYNYRDEYLNNLIQCLCHDIAQEKNKISVLQKGLITLLTTGNLHDNDLFDELVKKYQSIFERYRSVQIICAIYPNQQDLVISTFAVTLKLLDDFLLSLKAFQYLNKAEQYKNVFYFHLDDFLSDASSAMKVFKFTVEDHLWKSTLFIKLRLESLYFMKKIASDNVSYLKNIMPHIKKYLNNLPNNREPIDLYSYTFKCCLTIGEAKTALDYFNILLSTYKKLHSQKVGSISIHFDPEDLYILFSTLLKEKIISANEIISKVNDFVSFVNIVHKTFKISHFDNKLNPLFQIKAQASINSYYPEYYKQLEKVKNEATSSLTTNREAKIPSKKKKPILVKPISPPQPKKKDLPPLTNPLPRPPQEFHDHKPAPTFKIPREQQNLDKEQKRRKYAEKTHFESTNQSEEKETIYYRLNEKKSKKFIYAFITDTLLQNLPLHFILPAIKILEKGKFGPRSKEIGSVEHKERKKFGLSENITHQIFFKISKPGRFNGNIFYLFAHPEKHEKEDYLVFADSYPSYSTIRQKSE